MIFILFFIWKSEHFQGKITVEADVNDPLEGGDGRQAELLAPVEGVTDFEHVNDANPLENGGKHGL